MARGDAGKDGVLTRVASPGRVQRGAAHGERRATAFMPGGPEARSLRDVAVSRDDGTTGPAR